MEVFVGRIPIDLDSASIENFIYEQVRDHCDLTTASNATESVAAVPLNKGFFFKRIDTERRTDFGIITFASKQVAQWFLGFVQFTEFVIRYDLNITAGRNTPSKAFVDAIAENATVPKPSTSAPRQTQIFLLELCLVGHWAAAQRFNYTHSLQGNNLRLTIDEQNVILIRSGHSSLSFLPRDVRAYGSDKTYDTFTTFAFELKQNPQVSGKLDRSSRSSHHFDLPLRVVHIKVKNEDHPKCPANRLSKYLGELLVNANNIPMQSLQLYKDTNDAWLADFFNESQRLGIELAFLRESLLRNELVGTSALVKILNPSLNQLLARRQYALALRVLKNLVPKLEARRERYKTEEQFHKYTAQLWKDANAEAVSNTARGLLSFMEPSMDGDSLMSPFLHIDITPTRVLLSGPHWHMSNRVIRSYAKYWDHFARVSFTNESRESATTITPNYGIAESEWYIRKRVLNFLQNGIIVAGRKWELLAWSSSSMTAHTVWFCTAFKDANGQEVNADSIRNSLGNFKDVIRNPALYGARLSQAFSATATTIKVPEANMHYIPDIGPNKDEVHSDGVGQISPALMADVWESYLTSHGEHRKRKLLKASAPSAIQIRIGGSKGVLAVNPRLMGKVICLRQSMNKFSSKHQDLEVASSSSRCLPAKLNRPLINALDNRGVHVSAFIAIQKEAISQIGRARFKFDETARLCSAFGFGTGCNLRTLFQKLHQVGLGAATTDKESFFLVLAKAATAAALGDMKRKARIPVKGVTLLGIADEFGYLKEGEVFVQAETIVLGQVERRILTGKKLIGRSPTIDPSDVTMVECRKPPPGHPLLQLRNVVVFNTVTRKQPLPRRLGGGDLDGDLYTIYEDERLFPPTEQPDAIFHNKVNPLELAHDCHVSDLAEFFTSFMLNDFIGLVSILHLRISDSSELGAEDPRCKTLARLHSQATDFRKTGIAVTRQELPKAHDPILPDFLAQSEKKEGRMVYSSRRALGYLFREVSWNDTDTPTSLDGRTDAETGLERILDEDEDDDLDDTSEFSSLFGPEQSFTSSLRATMGAGSKQAFSAASSSGYKANTEAGTNPQTASQPSLASRISGLTGFPAAAANDSLAANATQATNSSQLLTSSQTANNAQAAAQPSLASRIFGLRIPADDPCPPPAAVDVAPWQFKDHTFPQLLERIGWSNRDFLTTSKDDDGIIAEGSRYAMLFQDFTRHLRSKSREIASYHPDSGKSTVGSKGSRAPIDGMFLVSEVYLLTGRLPWAKVCKRTRRDRDSNVLDIMQSMTTLLRKRLCRISEEAAFGKAQNKQKGIDRSNEKAAVVGDATTSSSTSSSRQTTAQAESSPSKPPRAASSRIVGNGSASAPFVVDSSDDEDHSDAAGRRSVTLTQKMQTPPLSTITNTLAASSISHNIPGNGLKRKASQEVDSERRSHSHTPTPSRIDAQAQAADEQQPATAASEETSTPTAPASPLSLLTQASPPPAPTVQNEEDMILFDDNDYDAATTVPNYDDEDEEEEEGQITVKSAQKTVDSLWRACHFFCSPSRPRYSNVYGYNTFMITLTLHLLSMLETLKHLHRNSASQRYFVRPSNKGKERDFGESSEDTVLQRTEEGGDGDDSYCLTEETMRAVNLGQLILSDMATHQGFDG